VTFKILGETLKLLKVYHGHYWSLDGNSHHFGGLEGVCLSFGGSRETFSHIGDFDGILVMYFLNFKGILAILKSFRDYFIILEGLRIF